MIEETRPIGATSPCCAPSTQCAIFAIVDILNAGCSEGHALERWAKYRGIAREEIMAIGDNFNDIEMLAIAGRPFIMGNASEELRQSGWEVTLSNDQNGVAAAVEQVLGESRISFQL